MALTVQIRKRAGNFCLEADFTAQAGEPLALLGASGCGKSMTLQCAAGILRPDWGQVALDGQTLFHSGRGVNCPPQKRRVGYLFQNYALFPHMTAAENIAAGARHLDKSRRREQTARLVKRLGLEGLENLRPLQLSGGQQQRVALARMLASEPRALLLDEPFSALDSYLKWRLEQELREILNQFPGPVVWVSHDWGEVCRNCAKVCVLDGGKSAPAVGVRELLANPVTVSAARISGCKNFAPARPGASPGTVEVPGWGLTLAAPWREGADTLGIRSQHLRPSGPGAVNAFFCQVLWTVEDEPALLAALRPQGAAADAPPLQMELARDVWAALPDRKGLWVSVDPENLLLLEQTPAFGEKFPQMRRGH